MEHPEHHSSKERKGMYFDSELAEIFADREQNEKNLDVAGAVDKVLMQKLPEGPVHAAELGGGAHADRYDAFFSELLSREGSKIDWVDVSPQMLNLIDKYLKEQGQQDRLNVIEKRKEDIITYLEGLDNDTLDIAISKYTLNYLADPQELVDLLKQKLKSGGRFVATIGKEDNKLKSHSTNAKYFYKGNPIPDGETRELDNGEAYTIQFLRESGNPDAGTIPGAETTVYHHDMKKLTEYAKSQGFKVFLGDWKELVDQQEGIDQKVLVLTK